MSTSPSDPLSNDASLVPAVAGQPPLVAGAPGNLGWATGPAPAGELPGAMSLATYFHAFRRHWIVATALGLLCGGLLGTLVYLARPPQYAAVAYIKVEAKPTPNVFADPNSGGRDLYEIYRGTQVQLIKSPYVVGAALAEPAIAALPGVRRNEPDSVGWLCNDLSVSFPQKEGEIMCVTLVGNDKEEITTLVNAVVDTYLNKVVVHEQEDKIGRVDKLETLRADKETEVRTALNNLRHLAEGTGGAEDKEALSVKQQVAVQQYAELSRELVRVQFDLMRARNSLRTSQTLQASLDETDVPAYEVDQWALNDPMLRQLADKLVQYKMMMQNIDLTVVPGSKSSYRRKAQIETDNVQSQYDDAGKKIREKIKEKKRFDGDREIKKLESEVQILAEQEQRFQADLEKQGKEVMHIGNSSIDIDIEKQKLKELNEVLGSIATEREKLKVELSSVPRITCMQKADTPKNEFKGSMRLAVIAIASLFGFCVPLFGMVLWDVQSRRVNAVSEVVHGLGLSVIGSVPAIPAHVLRRLGGTSKRSQTWRLRLTESLDGIAARLLHKAEREQSRVVLVSSAMAGEGKTTLATQLGMSLARHLRRTVLVDFDLRRPGLDGVFGVPSEPGVCEALRGEGDLAGMIQPTGTEHLSVLPAGRCDRRAMAALANGGAGPLFEQLRQQYDFVIIDSSPILPVADTRFVSQHADTVVLSVFRDLSEVPKIQATCEILDAFGVRDLEAVVTGGSGFAYGRGRQYIDAAAS